MKGRHTILLAVHGLLNLAALLLLLTALSQPLFTLYHFGMTGWSVTTIMGFEDLGLLYFIFLLALIALTASIRIIRLRWSNALRSTPVLASTILLLIFLIMWPPLDRFIPPVLSNPSPPFLLVAEGYYTYCLSCILLIAAQVVGPPIATRRVSFPGAEKTAWAPPKTV